jgi:nucleotide-binding universal stress UspA family protein
MKDYPVYKTILVPLDGSDLAASVLEQVGTLARKYGARLLLMTVGPSLPPSLPRAQDIQLTLTFQAEAYLEHVRKLLMSEGLAVETVVRIGDPACEILELAQRRQVDLIIISSCGGERAASPFLGSVAAKVAGASAIPVFVLHATESGEPSR